MVKKVINKWKEYFMCEACDMHDLTEELAKRCEDFCNKHCACDTSLIGNAVELD